MQSLKLVTSAALLSSLLLACGGPGTPPDPLLLPSGAECGDSNQCASGHCDPGSGLCCDGETCCRTASDCPSSFRSSSACEGGCQGTRQDALCEGFVCATVTVADDSGCAGSTSDCGAYAPAACTGSADQGAPTCPTQCVQKSDCATGFACNGNHQCVAMVGAGDACDAGRPCGDGLKCDNGVCCDQNAGSCCATPESCPAPYRASSACTITGGGTTCQGTARIATCTGSVCGTQIVQDDSGCAGQLHLCGGYSSIACSGAVTQGEPVCSTTCSGASGCAGGFRCTATANGTCVPAGTTGQTCTAWSTQGTCTTGLRCYNGACCQPRVCGTRCGFVTDGCGGTIDCGDCEPRCLLATPDGSANAVTVCP